MKKITTTLLFSFVGLLAFSQTNADIVGEWYNAEKDAVITLFEENESVSGKITWMQFPNDDNGNPKTDPLNPDENLKSRARMGMVMMSGFAYDEDSVWDDGELYDPKKGKTYSGMMTLKDKNTIDLRGYIGFSFIGRSSTWTRKLN
jgi:uncharacterized protein (DUF2147 family)|tara:strand:+ start:298 stop:735 length:438 start_codon:yes stop_codon:yes gene_type:complete